MYQIRSLLNNVNKSLAIIDNRCLNQQRILMKLNLKAVTTKLIVKTAAYLIGQTKRQLATRIKSILIT